jgi:hypothetical protein
MPLTRRTFFSLAALAPLLVPAEARSQSVPAGAPLETFPAHEPETVKEMVTVSHGNVARVRELLSGRPALANAGWDWGFGDWETSLGAASHVGNREIAALLLASGARPTIFSAAMLGQVDVVRAFVTASPGIQRTRGPHGITLLAHARAGKAADVVVFSGVDSGRQPGVSKRTARRRCAGNMHRRIRVRRRRNATADRLGDS